MTTVDRPALGRALRIVQPAVAKTSPIPALHGVHLQADSGQLHVTASNLDLTIVTAVACDDDPLDVVAPPSTLARILAAGRGSDALIDVDDNDALHVCAGVTATMPTFHGDWPVADRLDSGADTADLTADDMESIGRVVHAASLDMSRPVLTGVHLAGGHATASDSYRLARCDVDVDMPAMLVPSSVLRAVVADASGPPTVAFDGRRASFTSGPTTWTTMIVEGDFPDVDRVIASTEVKLSDEVTVDAGDLIDLLDRLKSLAAATADSPAAISASGSSLHGRRDVRQVGELADDIPADGTMGEVHVRPDFLSEAVEHARSDTVTLRTAGRLHPVWVQSPGYLALVMPVRTSS